MSYHDGPEGPSRLTHPQTELVENILGTSLLLPDKDTSIPANRQAASEVAYFLALEMVAQHTGRDISALGKQAKLPDTDITELGALPDVAFLSREVRIANNITGNLRQPLALPEYADQPDTPRARLQSTLIGRIAAHYQTLPTGLHYDKDSPLGVRLQDGFALIAKTGIGKTIVAALFMRLTGITEKTEEGQKPLEGTLVTSSLKLVKQFAGESGNNTFLRFLNSDIPVTKITGKHFDPSGRIRLTTTRSIFKFDPGDVLTIDEGHHALERLLAQYLGESSLRPLLLTATPAYNQHRDIRKLWSSFESPSTRKLIEDGVLNPTRILTFEFDDDPVPMVAATALAYMRTGRKVGIYCKPGEESAQANRIAKLINEAAGKRLIEAVSSYEPKSDEFEQEFDDGILRGLSTCKRLGEGWDATDADVGLFVDPGAALQLEQNGGRFMRPGKFVTELCEFFKRGVKRQTSFWKIMDLETADPGKIIGYKEPSEDEGQRSGGSGIARPRPDVLPLEDLPAIALDNLLIDKPLRRVLLGREDIQPSEGFTRKLQALAETHNVPAKWLQSKLDQQGFRYEGIRDFDPVTNESWYDRWYEGDPVDEWITKNPLPELAKTDEMTVKRMAEILETTTHHIEEIINLINLKPSQRLTKTGHQKSKHYDFAAFCLIHEKIEKDTPLADETDIVLGAFGAECGSQFVASWIARMSQAEERKVQNHKRRSPVRGVKGIAIHISLEDAERIRKERQEYDAIPVADPNTHTPIIAAARRAKLSLEVFEKKLTDEEREAIIPLRLSVKKRPGRYLPNGVIEATIERLKPIKLAAHLVPLRMYSDHFPVVKNKVAAAWITEHFGEPEAYRLEGSVRDTPCITWEQLRRAEELFGKRSDAMDIDYTKVVQGPEDTDPERWQYTQAVQRHYLGVNPSHPLAPVPEHIPKPKPVVTPILLDSEGLFVEPPVESEPKPKTTERIPRLIFSEISAEKPEPEPEPEPSVAPEPPRPEIPSTVEEKPAVAEQAKILSDGERRAAIIAARGNRPARRTEQSQPVRQPGPVSIPANFTNIDEYLGEKCHPRILNALIKSKKVGIRKDENNARWASDEDMLQLEEAIQRYPIAKPSMITGEQILSEIIKDYPNLPLNPGHIFHVASKVVSNMAGHVELCRAVQPDGTPGMLDYFYNTPIQAKIKERLEFILNSTLRTKNLLRFGEI
jgi:hypothetical protein